MRNLIHRRTLLFQLVKRDFQQRYIGSAAGWVWGLIHPLVLLASYIFIFGICLRMKPGAGEATQNYPMFLFAGMLPWLLFAETVQRSSASLVEQANLITRTVFPSEIVPLAIFLSSLIGHLLALLLAIAGAVIVAGRINPAIALLPFIMLLLGFFAVGIGWIAASLHVYLRDTAQVLAVILTLWFWVTPILLSENQFPAWAGFLVNANPLAYVVRAYREVLLGRNMPSLREFGLMSAFAISAFVLGGLFFRYLKRGFADVL